MNRSSSRIRRSKKIFVRMVRMTKRMAMPSSSKAMVRWMEMRVTARCITVVCLAMCAFVSQHIMYVVVVADAVAAETAMTIMGLG